MLCIIISVSSYFIYDTLYSALASSAPVIQFGDLVPCGIYARIVTDDFKLSGDNCAENIRRSWDVMNRYALSGRNV